jgi:hypothetical protein
MITTNIYNNLPSKTSTEFYEERDNSFYLTKITTNYDEGDVFTTSTPIACRALAFAIKAGTKIIVNGVSLEVYADAAASATQFFITATTLETALDFGSIVSIDQKNLFLQYQQKTEGTIAGMPVSADTLGPIEYKGGVYSITGVDPTYVKILPRDFMINEDGGYEALEFKDATNTGLQVGDAAQEMIATVNIPYGTTATEVTVWGSVTTKVVEAYVGDVSANGIGSAIGTGTTNGSAISLTSTPSSSRNYLLIIVKVTATSNRIYGGTVTLTQN